MGERLAQVTVVEKDILDLLPGEMTCDTGQKHWFIGCPGCHRPGALKHTVTRDEQGITVSPSLLCSCGAHYFVERNRIRWT